MGKIARYMMVLVVMTICLMNVGVTPAYANVKASLEEMQESDEETEQKETASEETSSKGRVVLDEGEIQTEETDEEQPFSTPGNGDLGDAISSGMKDFYTIHTKNNNTFFLVIDHAGNQDNVYMLSLIDEEDLSEFLDEKLTGSENKDPVVVVPKIIPESESQVTVTPTTEDATTESEEKPQQTNMNFITLIILAVIGGAAALYYFKIYKPKRNADEWESEGMETDDGLDTENEDEEGV